MRRWMCLRRLCETMIVALLTFGVVVGPASAAVPTVAAAPRAIVDLGALPGGASVAAAVSDDGVIVGSSTPSSSWPWHAVRWNRLRQITDLGSVDGLDTRALKVNRRGTTVGIAQSCAADGDYCALRWSLAGTLTRLPALTPQGGSYPWAINNFDEVVGQAASADGHRHPVRWTSAGHVVDLGLPPGGIDGNATGITDGGTAVGWASYVDGSLHALLWSRDNRMTELPAAPGQVNSWALAMTEDGLILGEVVRSDGFHMARWQFRGDATRPPELIEAITYSYAMSRSGIGIGASAVRWDRSGRVTVLAPLPTDAGSGPVAVNDAGIVVGSSSKLNGPATAVWWDRAGTAHALPTPSPSAMAVATAINDTGIVVGQADFPAGRHAALWH